MKRGALLWAECLRQALRDQRRTGSGELIKNATEQLAEWEGVVRGAFLTFTIIKDRWTIDDIRVPSFTDVADLGLTLACLPNEQDVSLYPWLSAASHHRLYPLLERLQSGTDDDRQPVACRPIRSKPRAPATSWPGPCTGPSRRRSPTTAGRTRH